MAGEIVRSILRAGAEVIAGLGEAGVATVHEAGSARLLGPEVTPIQQGARIAGSAVTVSCPPGDNLMIHAAVEVIGPGDVLVVATTAPADNGMFGELLAVSVAGRGCAGLVTDGGVRDVADLRRIGFPVWTRTVHAAGTTKTGLGSVNRPVQCAGVEVRPGDVIVADDDGVAVVELDRAGEVLELARQRVVNEDRTRQRLASGELGLDMYGFRGRLEEMGAVGGRSGGLIGMRVAVLGLGEAGSQLAGDLIRHGDEVGGYDPGPVRDIEGVARHRSVESAVAGCGLVLAVVPAAVARSLLEDVVSLLDDGAIYADLSTGAPSLKRRLGTIAAGSGVVFADVALMSAVPGRGLATPALASGPGADGFARLLNERGGDVEVVGEEAGEAATRKLLRSVMMKGLAALLVESTAGAAAYDRSEWLWGHLVEQLGSLDEAWMTRLLSGTAEHVERRIEEMEAARAMLTDAGVPAIMTGAIIEQFRVIAEAGMPQTGSRRGED